MNNLGQLLEAANREIELRIKDRRAVPEPGRRRCVNCRNHKTAHEVLNCHEAPLRVKMEGGEW